MGHLAFYKFVLSKVSVSFKPHQRKAKIRWNRRSRGEESESAAILIGHINLQMKLTGKPNVGNPRVGFDEAGTGNGSMERIEAPAKG